MTLFLYILAVLFFVLALYLQFSQKKGDLWVVLSMLMAVLGYSFFGFSIDFGYRAAFVVAGFLIIMHMVLLFYYFVNSRPKKAMVSSLIDDSERERMKMIFELSTEGLIYISADGEIDFVNEAATKIVGIDSKFLLGSDYLKFFRLFEEKKKTDIGDYLKVANAKGYVGGIGLVSHSNRGLVYVSYSLKKLDYAKGKYAFVLLLHDVEKERHIEQMRTDFVYIASHQLRAPVARMKWMAEMMIEDFGTKIPSELKTQLRHFYDANNDMLDLVKELLTVSSLDSDQLKLGKESVHIEDHIEEIIKKYTFFAHAHNAEVVFDHAAAKMPVVLVDPALLDLMLDNLITNAVSYSQAKIKNIVKITLRVVDDSLEFKISDSGIGIEKDELSHVFDIFYRGPEAKKTRTDGTGLGLYIVKTISDLHDAQIAVESIKGKGTTFTVHFPLSSKDSKEKK